mgnify:CR=1 FL=1|tara:strand:- start:240407 stop:241117 length:711 start_codon:yes stop_codon:yes gene_type:complete
MNGVLQLALALVFAIVAAGLNWVYLASQTNPTTYVAIDSSVEKGETIEDSDLVAIPVPGPPERLKQALIPYQNRSILLGNPAARDYEAGDMIFARDLMPPIDQQQWDVIGPFELISVAEQFKQPTQRVGAGSTSIGRNTVTIAVDANFDRNTSRLLQAITSERSRDSDSSRLEIVAVQVVPSPKSVTTASSIPQLGSIPRDETVYQTVSLDGIANVPEVLLEGDFIRFVVPQTAGQ